MDCMIYKTMSCKLKREDNFCRGSALLCKTKNKYSGGAVATLLIKNKAKASIIIGFGCRNNGGAGRLVEQ